MWNEFGRPVANPIRHPKVVRAVDVAHKPVQPLVALLVPLRDEVCQRAYHPQQIKPRVACCVQDIHENLGGVTV